VADDTKTRQVAYWAVANRDPDADILKNPPFDAGEAPEIIASAAAKIWGCNCESGGFSARTPAARR